MRRISFAAIFLCAFSLALTSCHEQEQWDNDALGNFDALWTIIDEHYPFFEYKDVDWNEVGQRYRAKIGPDMTSTELFALCGDMLKELRDGHTNLISSHDVSRYWIWEQYPTNYDERLIDDYYLHFDYKRASGIKYKILENNFGYMYYGSFAQEIGEGNLDLVLSYLSTCDGLIIDVRDNGGGILTNVERLVGRFIESRTLVGYIQHKTGPGHSEISEPYAYYFEPTEGHIHYLKPVVVIANRASYSATNNFVSIMKTLQQVTIVGDTTGGGCGLPFTADLPNGWAVRFSSSPISDSSGHLTEFGVEPDVAASLTDADRTAGIDPLIETATAILTKSTH